MPLEAEELKKGLKFIVGKWEIDYLVNSMSNNLEHLPAKEFKSKDGKDMSQISFEFFEDHTMKLRNNGTGEEESGTWEQTTSSKFKYTCDKFFGLLPPELVKSIAELERDMEGGLVFSLFLLVVRMKKTEEGHVTEEKKVDIGDLEADPSMTAIVGRYKVYKSLASVGEDFGMFTLAEVEADFKKKKEEGQFEDERYERRAKERMGIFGTVFIFTENHRMITLSPIPDDVSQKEIDEAVASGEVTLKDGMLCDDPNGKEWKGVNGDYWYNSEEEAVICGEKASPWRKITPDKDGRIEIQMFIIEKM